MKTLIVILILLSFLQVTLIPLNLVLIALIFRAYIVSEKENLYLAFFFGVLISFLNSLPLGLHSLIYLGIVQSIHLFKKTYFSGNFLVMLPAIAVLLSLNSILISMFQKSSIQLWPIIFQETLLGVPVYFVLKFWEERFSVKPEVKLKV